jgi:ABC-type branched-subunit amino acid transport system substrate-binding protein
MARTQHRVAVGLLLAAGALAACSSAPAPVALRQDQTGGTTGSSAPGTTTTGGRPTQGVTTPGGGTTGAVAVPGTTGSSSGTTTTGSAGGSTGSGATTGTTGPVFTGSTLFTPAEDRIGITPTSITMCAHAALTYGAAFNTTADDFNVFWTAVNTEKGGVFGRKVTVTYENDNYDPNTAVEAATACKAKGIFMLLGGIGFDQIPNVRNWAERNHMLYLHHTATVNGSKGLRYSFTELPTVERMGEGFAQLYLNRYRGKKIGIVERDSANWKPGADSFRSVLAANGITVVADNKVADKKHNYTQDILDMKNAGAEVVFLWENALNSTEFIVQAKRQVYSPRYLMFPFNLTSQTLGNDAMSPPLDGVAMFPAYSNGDYSGSFASYADDVKLFEQQYARYRPNADLSGFGGDLLFLNWTAQKALYAQLLACGKGCTRNGFVSVLQGYKARPTSSACVIDFTTGDGHHGADRLNFMQTYVSPSDKVNWRNTTACVGRP